MATQRNAGKPGHTQYRCPGCGNDALPEFSQPAGLVLCPQCGMLLRRRRGTMVSVGFSTETVTRLVLSRLRDDAIDPKLVEERVREVVATRLGIDKDAVSPRAHFVNDLGADSLDVVELVMVLEEEFGVDIDID